MTNLDYFLTDEFSDLLGFELPPRAMRVALARSQPVGRLIEAIRHGEVTDEAIRQFIAKQALEFRAGQRLPGDLALAALAVALERIPSELAEEYLNNMTKLELAEMPLSTRVAKECMKYRAELPQTSTRRSRYASARRVRNKPSLKTMATGRSRSALQSGLQRVGISCNNEIAIAPTSTHATGRRLITRLRQNRLVPYGTRVLRGL